MTGTFFDNPFDAFRAWFGEAEKSEPNDPNALCLATCTKQGRPSARMVLLKNWDERGFVFYTNSESRKGDELAENPFAALCFHWKSLKKQIRIEGPVELLEGADADAYFATRPRVSRIGAWASRQSRPLECYEDLTGAVATYEKQFEGKEDIPRPPYWNSYLVRPERFELWQEGEFRLHRRYLFTLENGAWTRTMLCP